MGYASCIFWFTSDNIIQCFLIFFGFSLHCFFWINPYFKVLNIPIDPIPLSTSPPNNAMSSAEAGNVPLGQGSHASEAPEGWRGRSIGSIAKRCWRYSKVPTSQRRYLLEVIWLVV